MPARKGKRQMSMTAKRAFLNWETMYVAGTQTTNCTAPDRIWMSVVRSVENPMPLMMRPWRDSNPAHQTDLKMSAPIASTSHPYQILQIDERRLNESSSNLLCSTATMTSHNSRVVASEVK